MGFKSPGVAPVLTRTLVPTAWPGVGPNRDDDAETPTQDNAVRVINLTEEAEAWR